MPRLYLLSLGIQLSKWIATTVPAKAPAISKGIATSGFPSRTIKPAQPINTIPEAMLAALSVCVDEVQRTHNTQAISEIITAKNATIAVIYDGNAGREVLNIGAIVESPLDTEKGCVMSK
jgi:hypothetical protein